MCKHECRKLALLETYKHCTAARCTLVLDSERGSLTWMRFSELSDVHTDRIGLFTLSELYQGGLQAEPAILVSEPSSGPLHLTSAYLRQLIPSHRTSRHPFTSFDGDIHRHRGILLSGRITQYRIAGRDHTVVGGMPPAQILAAKRMFCTDQE